MQSCNGTLVYRFPEFPLQRETGDTCSGQDDAHEIPGAKPLFKAGPAHERGEHNHRGADNRELNRGFQGAGGHQGKAVSAPVEQGKAAHNQRAQQNVPAVSVPKALKGPRVALKVQRALAGAGLLTDAQRDAVLRLLAELPGRPDANILSGGDGSFAAAACFGPDGGVSMTWHRDTGGVVALSFWGGALPQQADPAAMLAAWRAALGLDVLADWAEPALKDGAACRSDSAQLYLYCVESVDSLRMEMVVLTADAVLPGSADTAPIQK